MRRNVPAIAVLLVGCASTVGTNGMDATTDGGQPTGDSDTPPGIPDARTVLPDGGRCEPCAPCDWYCRDPIESDLSMEWNVGGGAGATDYERPIYPVVLVSFEVFRYEVTNSASRACVGAGRCPVLPPAVWESSMAPGYSTDPAYDDHPAVNLTWFAANRVCEFLNAYLLSSAEWEAAARGRDARRYPWGDRPRCDGGWYAQLEVPGSTMVRCGDDRIVPARVGSFPAGAGPFGTLDLLGNVREATVDYADEHYNNDVLTAAERGRLLVDPVGPPTGFPDPVAHIWRGGDLRLTGAVGGAIPISGESSEQRWTESRPLGARCRWPPHRFTGTLGRRADAGL